MDNAILRTKADAAPTNRRARQALSLADRSEGRSCATARHRLGMQKRSLLSRWRWMAVSCVAALSATCLSVIGDPPPAAAAACAPRQVSVAPDTGLNNLFQTYGNSGTGRTWTGGDGTESVALPDGRELWLFDDTFLGTVTNGQRIWARTPYSHNSFVVEDHGVLTRTYFTHRTTRPSAYGTLWSGTRTCTPFGPEARL